MSGDVIGAISREGYLETTESGGTATIFASYTAQGQSFVGSKKITALTIVIGGDANVNW